MSARFLCRRTRPKSAGSRLSTENSADAVDLAAGEQISSSFAIRKAGALPDARSVQVRLSQATRDERVPRTLVLMFFGTILLVTWASIVVSLLFWWISLLGLRA
jgi:hypothetical protein